MTDKLELRKRQKGFRATLPDVSSLVCGHLVGWLRLGLGGHTGEHKVRPYTNPQDRPHMQVEKTVISRGQTQGSAPTKKTITANQNESTVGANPRVRPADQPMILLYKAFGTEISLETLPQELPHCQFLTTRVNQNHTLTLHDFASATEQNRFGILEPPPNAPAFAPEWVDVALIPGLAFSRDGGRLGYGGGFYDRLLPQLRPDCVLVGITHSSLLLPTLPLERHDVKMQFLALETGVVAVQ